MSTATTATAADDTAWLQAWLDSGRDLPLGPRAYTISAPLHFNMHGQEIEGEGIDSTRIICVGDFEAAVSAGGLRNVAIRGLTIDCARAARLGVLTSRTIGIDLTNCVGGVVEHVRVTGTVGGPAAPGSPRTLSGVGIAVSGGERCLVRHCTLDDLGLADEGRRSDGIYTAGDHHLIDDCDVAGATDTAFVIEDSDHSGVTNSRATNCCGVLGITAATRESRGNFAAGITASGWDSAVVGGVQLAALAGFNLLDTAVYGLRLTGPGVGPALNIRTATGATGRVVGVLVRDPNLTGSGLVQGILVDGSRVTLDRPVIVGFENGIQVEAPAGSVAVLDPAVSGCSRYGLVVKKGAAAVRLLGGSIAGAVAGVTGLDGATITRGD
jgi:hypothetical protein